MRIQAVVEIYPPEEFTLWPVAWAGPVGFLALDGDLDPIEVGTAMMAIAGANDVDFLDDDRPPRPADPLGGLLHGLLTLDPLFAPGGIWVTDTSSGTTLVPGCCSGIEDWRGWHGFIDGGARPDCLGQDPSPLVERHGDTVRMTVDADQEGSPVMELPVDDLRRLLAGVETDLIAFHRLAAAWAGEYVPDHAGPVTAALARLLDVR